MNVKSELWHDRIAAAKKTGVFAPRDRAEAVLANKGPAEELGHEHDLRMRSDGGFGGLVFFGGTNGRKILDGSGFATALVDNHAAFADVRRLQAIDDPRARPKQEAAEIRMREAIDRAEKVLLQIEEDVTVFLANRATS